MYAFISQRLHFRLCQTSIVPAADRTGLHPIPNGLFQGLESRGVGVLGAEDRPFRSTTEVVGQKDPVLGRQVVPDEVSRICQNRGKILVEGLDIPYIDQS